MLQYPSQFQHNKPGTARRCDCHGEQVMAIMRPDIQTVEVRDRRHGTAHQISVGLKELVRVLDPTGTTARLLK